MCRYLEVEFRWIKEKGKKQEIEKVICFLSDVCKEEIWRLPESPKIPKYLPEFHQQELATLVIYLAVQHSR